MVLITVIPRLTRFFKNKGLHPTKADQSITVMSGVSLATGSVLLFFSKTPSVAILGQAFTALGFAFTVTARSFLTSMVDAQYLSILYTSITAVTYGGVIVGGPLLACAFQWGLRLGHFWVGMPFLITAVLFATATLAVYKSRGNY